MKEVELKAKIKHNLIEYYDEMKSKCDLKAQVILIELDKMIKNNQESFDAKKNEAKCRKLSKEDYIQKLTDYRKKILDVNLAFIKCMMHRRNL